MTDDEKNWLAADYVLGVMRGTERASFEGQLKNDPVLAKSVLGWQQRLSLIDAKPQVLYPTMSEAEVDAALSSVFERVCKAIDAQPDAKTRLDNPLAKLTREQLAGMRPAVVRLIASYLVLLERLKAQQLRMATGSAGAV
jgi:anti-sigma-K factor RskA